LAQRRLAELPGNDRADVVVAAVPGDGEPLGEPLLARLRPQVIVLVSADYPSSARAPAALRQRLAETGARLLVTDETGAVTLRETAGGLRLEPWRGISFTLPRPAPTGDPAQPSSP
ncbi:MAG: hypothetical protein ACKOET_13730, partial [Verrucomicrobiota bacterium]